VTERRRSLQIDGTIQRSEGVRKGGRWSNVQYSTIYNISMLEIVTSAIDELGLSCG